MAVDLRLDQTVTVVTYRQKDKSWRSIVGELRGLVPHPAGVGSTPEAARSQLMRGLSAAESDLRALKEVPTTSAWESLSMVITTSKPSTVTEDITWGKLLDQAKALFP